LQVQGIRRTDLRYLLPQLFNAFSDGLLHDGRLAEPGWVYLPAQR
jgi:hypothetical protein